MSDTAYEVLFWALATLCLLPGIIGVAAIIIYEIKNVIKEREHRNG